MCPCSLDQKNTGIDVAMEFSRSAPGSSARSFKTQQRTSISIVEVDVVPGEPVGRTAEAINGAGACRSKSSGIPRKEVIQPQLPLRLPCYDFTPIIDPTFDGSLPCGLGHRLRVLPTFVV